MISIDEAISASERRSKRLWLVSIVWVCIMIIVVVIFGIAIYQFNQTRTQINVLKETATNLIADLQKHQDELSLLERTSFAQGRQLYALSLLMRGPEKLTPVEKEFVARETNAGSLKAPSSDFLIEQGISEFNNGKFNSAYNIFSEVLSSVKDNKALASLLYSLRSQADFGLEDFAKATADVTEALILGDKTKDRLTLLMYRADALTRMGRYEEAEKDIAEVMRSDDPSVRGGALNSRGLIKLKKQDWIGAETDFRSASQLQPGSSSARLDNVGIIYLSQGEWSKAYEWSSDIIQLPDKSSNWIWIIRALAADKLGKTSERDEAVREYQKRLPDPGPEGELSFYLMPGEHGMVGRRKSNIDELSFYLPEGLAQIAKGWAVQREK
jgi:tetratricopeptide (TPR) repeat protein